MSLEHFGFRHHLHSSSSLQGRDFLLHIIGFVLSFSVLICWGLFGEFGKNPSFGNELIYIINLGKIGEFS